MYAYSNLDCKSSQNAFFFSLLNSVSITIIHQIKTPTTVDNVAFLRVIMPHILRGNYTTNNINNNNSLYFLNMYLIKNI